VGRERMIKIQLNVIRRVRGGVWDRRKRELGRRRRRRQGENSM